MQAGLARLQVDLLAGAGHHARLQVDDAFLAERVDLLAGVSIQFDQTIAGGDVNHAVVPAAVGPVCQAAPR